MTDWTEEHAKSLDAAISRDWYTGHIQNLMRAAHAELARRAERIRELEAAIDYHEHECEGGGYGPHLRGKS